MDGLLAGGLFVIWWAIGLALGALVGLGPIGGIVAAMTGAGALFWWLVGDL